MKLAVLFSGGKDSVFACYRAMEKNSVFCLISLISESDESYMFHTPNILRAGLLAEAMEKPLITWPTKGEEEKELVDLRDAVKASVEQYGIEGVVTGAIESVYQATRVQRICRDLDLWCFNPLWQVNQLEYMRLLVSLGFKVIVSGVFAYPLDQSWVGAELTEERIDELEKLQERYRINPAGEGGELETFVTDGPLLAKRILITKATSTYQNYRGRLVIEEAELVAK